MNISNNTFYGVTSLNQNFYTSSVEDNLKSYINYNMLNIGGFVNVNVQTSGLYNNITFDRLKPINAVGQDTNTIWQTPKRDWVWESDVSFNNSTPNAISGIYVNNTLYPAPSGSGAITYTLDYPNGSVIFNNPLSSATKIHMAYSYRWCQVIKSVDSEWKLLQQLTYKPTDTTKTNLSNILGEHRLQMPCIVIEPTPNTFDIPYELGSLKSYRNQDILLHVYSENLNDNNKIVDILRLQKDNNIVMYDIKKLISDNVYPLQYNGSINPSGLNYSEIINNSAFHWKKLYIKDINLIDQQKNTVSDLIWCMLRMTVEVIL